MVISTALAEDFGTSLTVVQKSSANAVLMTKTVSLRRDPAGWYAYFYAARQQVRDTYVLGLLPVSGSRIEITVTGPAACAAVVLGTAFDIGQATRDTSSGISDYSKKTTSVDGVQTFAKGRYARVASFTLLQDAGRYTAISQFFEEVRATPLFWIGAPDLGDYEPLTLFGAYTDFRISVPYPTQNLCTLEIQGLSS